MPASEIDDIFSGKTKTVTDQRASVKGKAKASDSASLSAATISKSKKKKKRKLEERDADVTGDNLKRDGGDAEPTATKKKKKKRTKDDISLLAASSSIAPIPPASTPPKPKRIPETVFDPSSNIGSVLISTRGKGKDRVSAQTDQKPVKSQAAKGESEDVKRFKDSRGTGPRKRTDDGYLIYKEDELGIKDEGGDTPLCPFDCECCF